MNTLKRMRRAARIAVGAGLALASVGVVGTAATGVASAATCCGTLAITYHRDLPASRPYIVSVYGRAAKYYNPTTTRIEVRLWGDDPVSDDLRAGPYSATDWTGSEAAIEFAVSGDTLNEDWEGRDELYVGIRIIDKASGKVLEGIETYRVSGSY